MKDILQFLMAYCSFLYENNRFKFVDSRVASSFGGDAFLVLASDSLKIRFVRDRGQLFLDFQSLQHGKEADWFSIDVLHRLVTGEKQESAELTGDYASFLRENLEEIESRFSSDRLTDTVKELRKLEQTRAKELFG